MVAERAAFFMPIDIQVIDSPEVEKTAVSLKAKPKAEVKKITLETVELSKGIQKFDNLSRKKVYSENPYSHQAVRRSIQTQTASTAVTNPIYNYIGKYLGIDTRHDWDRYYDKIVSIADWAKRKSGESDLPKVISWLGKRSKSIPSVGGNTLTDLYLFSKLEK